MSCSFVLIFNMDGDTRHTEKVQTISHSKPRFRFTDLNGIRDWQGWLNHKSLAVQWQFVFLKDNWMEVVNKPHEAKQTSCKFWRIKCSRGLLSHHLGMVYGSLSSFTQNIFFFKTRPQCMISCRNNGCVVSECGLFYHGGRKPPPFYWLIDNILFLFCLSFSLNGGITVC